LLWGFVIHGNQDKLDMGEGEKGSLKLSDLEKGDKKTYNLLLLGDDNTSDIGRALKGMYGPGVSLVIANPEKYGFVRIRFDGPLTFLKYVGDLSRKDAYIHKGYFIP